MKTKVCCTFVLLACVINVAIIAEAEEFERLPAKFYFPQYVPPSELVLDIQAAKVNGKLPEKWQGKLQIDGVATEIIWPGHIPATYQINARFYLIFEGHNSGKSFVWDVIEKKTSLLGPITIGPNTKFGHIITRYDRNEKNPTTHELLHFDPKTGELRPLYRHKPLGSLIGLYHGGLAFSLGHKQLVVLKPGEVPQKLAVDYKGYTFAQNHDAIRGDKMLLMEVHSSTRFLTRSSELFEYDIKAAILDLKTGEVKNIGVFAGGWSNHTALPRPAYGISWVTKDESKKLHDLGIFKLHRAFGGGWAYVAEGTEKLIQPQGEEIKQCSPHKPNASWTAPAFGIQDV